MYIKTLISAGIYTYLVIETLYSQALGYTWSLALSGLSMNLNTCPAHLLSWCLATQHDHYPSGVGLDLLSYAFVINAGMDTQIPTV